MISQECTLFLIPKGIGIDYVKSKLVRLQGEESVQKYPKGGRKREKRKNRTAWQIESIK